ncbi:MAG: exodeoxyribonuclease VII large subunit [Nitrospirota bacterium]
MNFQGPITVSELTRRIREKLESGFSDVWITGEISGLRIPSSGHLYFTLKDKNAQIKAVFFRSGNRFLKFVPKDGLEVILRGRLTVYDPRGEYQVVAEYMEPQGIGALQLAFIQLKERLEKEGLFDQSRKRPLPSHPRRVGVVTSTSGAAIRDILNVLGRRAPGVGILIAPATVQGDSAPAEIVSAIAELNKIDDLDVIIAGRGGGSIEDLAAFNTEIVARAIASSRIPVISAVGHETDFTIADFAADFRAPTPSAAAEIVAKNEEDLRDALRGLRVRLVYAVVQEHRRLRAKLSSEERALINPMRRLQDHALRLDELSGRLVSAQARYALAAKNRLVSLSRALSLLEPLAPLKAGFVIVKGLSDGRIIKSSLEAMAEGGLILRFNDGEIKVKVVK